MNSHFHARRLLPIALTLLVVLLAGVVIAPRPATPEAHAGLAVRLSATPARLSAPWPAAPTPQEALDRLRAAATGPLHLVWDRGSDIPQFVAGATPDARLPYVPSAAERGNSVAIARGFLDANRALFRLASVADELDLLRVELDRQLGFQHVRLRQVYRGVPVFGRQLIVHIDPQERIVAVNGQFRPQIDIPSQPTITATQAQEIALRDLRETQLGPDERVRVQAEVRSEMTELVVYVDQHNKPTLTWQVTIHTHTPLGQWRFFVNARRPVVAHRFDSLGHAKVRRTYTAQNTTRIPGRLLIEEGQRSRNQVAQAAHDAAGKVYDYYSSKFKRDGIDGQGSPIVSTVNYGSSEEDAENAAWLGDAQQMIYGDGGRIFRPLAYGLDVVGHEMTHGVIDSTAQLIYQGMSGALNEAYADIFGALIEGNNWEMGEEIVKSPPFPTPYLRSLEDPNLGGRYDPNDPLNGIGQPAHMREYADLPLSRRYDNGGVHINSGIPARAAFLIAQAIGKEKTEQIYFRTMTQYLSPNADFFDHAAATIRAANDLYGAGDAEAVRKGFAEVGIEPGGAAPSAPEPEETPRGPAQPVPEERLPAGCTELVTDGGFEGERTWIEVTTRNTAIIDPELPHTGARSAWLGGTDQEPVQLIYQDVRIPANATRIELSYWRYLHFETTGVLGGLLAPEARFGVIAATTGGDVIDTIEQLDSTQGDDQWRRARHDVSTLAGKTVRLTFVSENPRGNVSSMFVDDVALVACTTGAGPAAPPTGAANRVYIQGTITNVDTGRGIEGAQLFVLRPGLSATRAAEDDAVQSNEVLTMGVTDRNGLYQTEQAVPSGQVYSVIVLARGYRPVVADDGMEVAAGAGNPFIVDVTLRRSR